MKNHPDNAVDIEVKASTVSEAIQKGLIQLGVTRDDVKIEVLSEGSSGFFGIGAEDARVRLRLRRPPARQPEPEPDAPPAEVEEPTETEAPAPPPEVEPEAPPEPVEEELPEPEPEEEPPAVPEVDIADIAIETVQTLVERIGVSATVEFRQRGQGTSKNPILIDVKGEDVGVLIGHQGATLQALQYVTRLIVSRQTHQWTNIVIDVDGYRQRREESLREFAHRMANRVRRNGRALSLEPMPPNERRIIHLTLQDDPDVTTQSVGQGDDRKVTIRPQS